ncbi:MAG: hypothetical protein EPN74_17080 [Rhodanobacter sp.]|nr:MAG: hypothetical protein EPN74_17080 [Rhodanobacter sp.]
MWPAFIGATRAALPDEDTKIAFDKFHVAKHLADAVDKVRRTGHKAVTIWCVANTCGCAIPRT